MPKRTLFHKAYTRDNCFILQEQWDRLFRTGVSGAPNPYFPANIYYIDDGVVEIWENADSRRWFLDDLLAVNRRSDRLFRDAISKYRRSVAALKLIWAKGRLRSLAELRKFIALVEEANRSFLIYYYSGEDERSPVSIRQAALKVRATDRLYDENDRVIRNTVHFLYPHISYDLALSLRAEELAVPPSVAVLKRRQRHCVFLIDKSLSISGIGGFLARHPLYHFRRDRIVGKTKGLKGETAYGGRASGAVRILRRKSQIASFRPGEILVSPMTTPTFLPAMKKAAAIVTDEGGITCHAAVVAREVKTPCVVGTKVATQLLHDGDLVSVDADRGLVRIIGKV